MSKTYPYHIVVAGCGSIGKRHIGNLLQSKVAKVSAFDVVKERRHEVQEKFNIETVSSIEDAIQQKPDAVFICTPNIFHIENAFAFAHAGCHLFVEKPLSHTMEHLDELVRLCEEKQLITLVGCNLRFHPGLKKVKSLLQEKQIGTITSAECHVGQYLPDWHPWEDYRKGYSARQDLGGGIILDAIHEIDYARWLFGDVKSVVCFGGKLSHLEIDTEDSADILVKFAQNMTAYIHLDYIQRFASRFCRVIGDEGTVYWDGKQKLVQWFTASDKEWHEERLDPNWDPNQMYLDETAHFLHCLQGDEMSVQDIRSAAYAMKIALAAKSSIVEHRIIDL
jgi:predicted dehydrogenase